MDSGHCLVLLSNERGTISKVLVNRNENNDHIYRQVSDCLFRVFDITGSVLMIETTCLFNVSPVCKSFWQTTTLSLRLKINSLLNLQ